MANISNRIYQIIKEEKYADPFSINFDSAKVVKEFGVRLNEDENNTLQFLHICNSLFKEVKEKVFQLFNKIKLKPDDLREFLFIAVNKYFLDLTPQVIEQLSTGVSHDNEKTTFSKFINTNGQKINAQSAVEIGGDILSILINLSHSWTPTGTEPFTFQNLNYEEHGKLFYALWLHANIILNIRNSAYDIVKYENGKVIIRNEKEIKIENGSNSINFLKNAGIIRANNNTQEVLIQLMQLNEKVFENRVGVSGFETNGNILSPLKGIGDAFIKAKADSNLLVFYPYFKFVKLEYFDNLNLQELLDLLILIEECIEKLSRKNIENYSERSLNDIPIKFNKIELITFLSESSGHKLDTITKFISSLTANALQPYFWREPFIEVGDYLYFSLAAIVSPNHSLYFDKWTELSGYTLDTKEIMFKTHVLKELEKTNFEFRNIDLDKLIINAEIFKNNILIETTSLIILLEIKLFDYPIESSEIESSLHRLGNATFDIEEKMKQITETFNCKKEPIKIIITNYNNFSGLQINNVPIADIKLLKNYVFVGYFRRAAVTFHEGEPFVTDGSVISYYTNEIEFNKKLKNFFSDPFPIRYNLNRLCLKEQQITPDIVKPKFIIDIVDHITDDELMDSRMENLSSLLNYEYFAKTDKITKDLLDESIIYSLSEIFSTLSYAPYESYKNRIELYNRVSRAKLLGFAHLSFFMLKALDKLNGKKFKKTNQFEVIEYEPKEVFAILEKGKKNISGKIRLSEFKIENTTFTEEEEKKIISFSIDLLNGITPIDSSIDTIESLFLPLAFLYGLSPKYDVDYEFYMACSNIIDALNHIHKYQTARNLCEEILILSIENNKHYYGWNTLFKCYTNQKNNFDASIYGSLLITSVSTLPEIPDFLAVEVLYGALKYFRNFGFKEFSKNIFESLKYFDLKEYDKQKITLTYFNTFFQGEIQKDISFLDQIVDYVDNKIDDIIQFNEHGVIPWLALFYNIERFKFAKQITYSRDIKKYINKLENSIDRKTVDKIKNEIIGDKIKPKEQFISAILNTFETNSIRDFIHETQLLSIIASNLLQSAIINDDIDGMLLAGLIINDQSFTFKDISIEPYSVAQMATPVNTELELQLNHYKYYILSRITLNQNQLLIWLFEDFGEIYSISVNSNKLVEFHILENWDFAKMNNWLKGIGNFFFNSKADKFNNPRKEYHYEYHAQLEDYECLQKEFGFTNISFPKETNELLICNSIEMASFPHNLIQKDNNFISSQMPVCNVISIERFLDKSKPLYLKVDYSVSAWIPTDDKESLISWGYSLLEPVLIACKAKIFSTTYPKEYIESDLNVFLAHGVRDESGFKAVYTNHIENKVIAYPYEVFGKGKVAILFICNSGSSHEELFSNSVVSFSGELLKLGYESVVAPFWPFDVTMSKIWLEEFLQEFNSGYSINESVYLANKKLSEYDAETSNMFYAPAGCLAMHLYGNPNVYVRANPISKIKN